MKNVKTLILALSLTLGASNLAKAEPYPFVCKAKNIELSLNVDFKESQEGPTEITITRKRKNGTNETKKILAPIQASSWAKGHRVIDRSLSDKEMNNSGPHQTPRELAKSSSFAFYHHLGTFEANDGDNDSFVVLDGKIIGLSCEVQD